MIEIPGFKIEQLIAEGGMSSVYLALQESLGRRVACKVLKKFDSPSQAERFLHEGRIIASLNHRNIITIHDIGAIDERHYIAMEYLEGGSLADRIAEGMSPGAALALITDMALCLDFVHQQGIVHRDVKPGNILFHADGTPKLSDFGIAKQLHIDQELTLGGSALGSPYYLSPEQAEGKTPDGRSDIYGLGIIFYEMLTGQKPYAAQSHIETIVAHLGDPIPLLPEEFSLYQPLFERMVAKSPDQRTASAQELLETIRALPRPAHAERRRAQRPPTPPASDTKPITLKRYAPAIAAGLLITIAGFVLWPASTPEDTAATEMPQTAPNTTASALNNLGDLEQAAAALEPPSSAIDPLTLPTPNEPIVSAPSVDMPSAPTDTSFVGSEPQDDLEPVLVAIEPPNSGTTPQDSIEPTPEEHITSLMQSAQEALANLQLTTPANDNALDYYQQVIIIEPDHTGAQAGIDTIADRYARLARKAHQDGNTRLARVYLQRGFEVRPGHAGLQTVRKEIAQQPAQQTIASHSDSDPISDSESIRGEGSGNIIKDFQKVWRSIFD